MINRDELLKSVQKTEDKLIAAKIIDKAFKTGKTHSIEHTDFLDPRQKSMADKLFQSSELEYSFSGGYIGAEREVMFFCPEYITQEEFDEAVLNAFKAVSIKLNAPSRLSHRDFLGTVMALGIKREKTGDIVIVDNGAFIVVMSDIAEYVASGIQKVGNIGVSTEITDVGDITLPERTVKGIRSTVASLRLDSVAGTGFGISRTKVAELIRAEKVSLNWEVVSNTAKLLKEGDVISIRGKGRAVLAKVGGTSKKDRLFIEIDRYI